MGAAFLLILAPLSAPVLAPLVGAASPTTQADEQHRGGDGQRWDFLGVGWNDLLMLVFVGMQAWILARQREIMDRQRIAAERQTDISDRQREASARQAELDLPRLLVVFERCNFGNVFGGFAHDTYTSHDTLTPNESPFISYAFRNYGRSPAIITSLMATVSIGAVPAAEAEQEVIAMPRDRVVNGGKNSWQVPMGMVMGDNPITRTDYEHLKNGRHSWWLSGRVEFSDVWERRHAHHFCWRIDHRGRVFDPYPAERNRTERVDRGPHHDPAARSGPAALVK